MFIRLPPSACSSPWPVHLHFLPILIQAELAISMRNIFPWTSKMQSVISTTFAKAEYHALAHTTAKVVWLRRLHTKMGLLVSQPAPL